jgi:hypothetical protein
MDCSVASASGANSRAVRRVRKVRMGFMVFRRYGFMVWDVYLMSVSWGLGGSCVGMLP